MNPPQQLDLAVHVDGLTKVYRVPEREPGLRAALRSLVRRKMREVRAVDGVRFDIAPGEVIGFLGPNGAGKTTTLKMLSGLLYPTAGVVTVLGHVPSRREREFLRRITLVMGQRNQLAWDIPAGDSFELNRVIYEIEPSQFRDTMAVMVELLELGDLLRKPVRNLSLGERMKVEICASLLHRPPVLFLDEPTLGLDVTAQRRIREFLGEYNRRYGSTILLTSHYMADVQALCRRVIVIHHGKILYDGDLTGLVAKFSTHKKIVLKLEAGEVDLSPYGEVVERGPGMAVLRVPKQDTSRATARLLSEINVIDLTVEDPPIEQVIEEVFAQQASP
jgi:ABC-2 type transport system ATP-binding protein